MTGILLLAESPTGRTDTTGNQYTQPSIHLFCNHKFVQSREDFVACG
jgi:hypothetical protein